LHQSGLLVPVRIVQGCLHYIVGKIIINHVRHSTRTDHLLDQEVPVILTRNANTLQSDWIKWFETYLLDDVGAKLCLGQSDDIVLKLMNERRQVGLGLVEDILKDIISELIL